MKLKTQALFLTLLLINLFLIYVTPRLLLNYFEKDSAMISFLYQYAMGGLFFLNGVVLVVKSKACSFESSNDRFWFRWMFIGFAVYFCLHLSWIYLAKNTAVRI